jgi:hypothetical protein
MLLSCLLPRNGRRAVLKPIAPVQTDHVCWRRQQKSRAALGGGKIQRAPGLTIDQIVVPRRTRAYTPNGVSLYARWLLLRVIGVGQSEEPEPPTVGLVGELRPYERSRWAEHGGSCACIRNCARPTGIVVMLAPQTLMSNASVAQILQQR